MGREGRRGPPAGEGCHGGGGRGREGGKNAITFPRRGSSSEGLGERKGKRTPFSLRRKREKGGAFSNVTQGKERTLRERRMRKGRRKKKDVEPFTIREGKREERDVP